MSDEHEDLVDLQAHPGWLRWREQLRGEWGAKAYAEKVDAAAAAEDLVLIRALRLAKASVLALATWPDTRVKAIEHQRTRALEPEPASRRGPL